MKAVCRGQVASGEAGGGDGGGVLGDGADSGVDDGDVQGRQSLHQSVVQSGTAYSQAGPGYEARVDGVPLVEVPDPVERAAGKFHAQAGEVRHRAVGDAFTAGLVDRCGTRLDDHDRQAGQGRSDRRGGTRWTAAGHQKIDHVTSADFNAASSARMRTASSGMFSTVNTTAVTHAVCTSGKAMPSATTAT